MSATKHDGEKNRLDLLPVGALEALGRVLTYGAKKYGSYNWAKGMAWSRLYGAALRHLFAWWKGENTDPETGESHLAHTFCCLAFLLEYERCHKQGDDRPVYGNCSAVPTGKPLPHELGGRPRTAAQTTPDVANPPSEQCDGCGAYIHFSRKPNKLLLCWDYAEQRQEALRRTTENDA